MQRLAPELLISMPEVLWHDGTHFGESLHCNRKGAERLTARLAVEITSLLAVHVGSSAHASHQEVAKFDAQASPTESTGSRNPRVEGKQ